MWSQLEHNSWVNVILHAVTVTPHFHNLYENDYSFFLTLLETFFKKKTISALISEASLLKAALLLVYFYA